MKDFGHEKSRPAPLPGRGLLAVGHRRFHRRLISNAPPAQKKKIGRRTYDPPNAVGGISDPLLRLIFKDHYRWVGGK
jgi:hypothetical protein